MKRVGVLGGSFDPVHRAHVELALSVKHQLQLDRFCLVPCHVQPLKHELQASTEDRLAMLRLALADFPDLSLDTRELMRGGPSYTVDTLRELRDEHGGETSINFILGQDAWKSFCRWHRWSAILELANLVVLHRPGYSTEAAEAGQREILQQRQVAAKELTRHSAGKIALLTNREYEIASTEIRRRIYDGRSIAGLVHPKVEHYIVQHALYKTSVPSNELKQSS